MKSTRPLIDGLELCAFCGEPAQWSEDFNNVEILTGEGKKFDLEPLFFCSNDCYLKYYQFSLQRTREIEYDHRVRVFYTRMLLSDGAGKERLNETWRLLWKGTSEHLVDDVQYGIMLRIIETFVNSYVRLIRPSLLDFYDTDSRYFLMSAIITGRNLLYILEEYQKKPFLIENLCSVHIIETTVYLLQGNGVILEENIIYGVKKFSPIQNGQDVVLLSHNRESLVALKTDGSLWARGTFYMYHIFRSIHAIRSRKFFSWHTSLTEVYKAGKDNISLAVGPKYVMVVKTDGSLWVAGDTIWSRPRKQEMSDYSDEDDEIVQENIIDIDEDENPFMYYNFVQIPLNSDRRVLYVTCLHETAYIVKENNTIWSIETDTGEINQIDIKSSIHPGLLSDIESENIMILKANGTGGRYEKKLKGIISYCHGLDAFEMFMTKKGKVYANDEDDQGAFGGRSFNTKPFSIWKRVEYQKPLQPFYQHQPKRKYLPESDDFVSL